MRNRTGPLVTAFLLLAGLAAVRFGMRADSENVWLLGRRTGSACAFREYFGIPCPNCGMTRSAILTIQGDVSRAIHLNPAGPLLIAGVLAVVLFLIAACRNTAVLRWTLPAALAYAGLYVAVLIGHWIVAIA